MPKSRKRKNRKTGQPVTMRQKNTSPILKFKADTDANNAYVKVAGRMGEGKLTNPAAKKLAKHIGVQVGENKE